jgi:hypothetical protein
MFAQPWAQATTLVSEDIGHEFTTAVAARTALLTSLTDTSV